MRAVDCARLVAERLGDDDIVIGGLGGPEAAYKEVGPVGLTYFASDPMGLWCSVALGLALARPDRRVTFLAGDGDLIMNLQSLITVADVSPANLRIVVFQNGSYSSGGGQRLAGAESLSLTGVALAVSIPWAVEVHELEDAQRQLDALLARPGPAMLAVRIADERAPANLPGPQSQVEVRTLFMERLSALEDAPG